MKEYVPQNPPPTFETVWASLQETDRVLSEKLEELREVVRETNRQLGGMANSNGDVAEDYFINSFTKSMEFAGQEYESIAPNLSRRSKKLNLTGEFDLVLYNCNSVAIIEIKYKADKDHIESLLEKPQIFKQLFPEYANFGIYLGLAGLSVDKKAEIEAKKQGIAVIKQVGKTMVIDDKNLKVF